MIATHHGKRVYICDFCGKWQRAVEIMLQSPLSETCICSDCVEVSRQFIAAQRQQGGEA